MNFLCGQSANIEENRGLHQQEIAAREKDAGELDPPSLSSRQRGDREVEAVRAVLSVMVSHQASAASGDQPGAHAEEGQPTGR